MHFSETGACHKAPVHPTDAAIDFALEVGETASPQLEGHLAECPECNDLVLFVRKFRNGLRHLIGSGR